MSIEAMKLALEAGVRAAKLLDEFGTEGALCDSEIQDLRAAERLAQAAYAAGAAAEREACAMEADYEAARWAYSPEAREPCEEVAKAIRARGEK